MMQLREEWLGFGLPGLEAEGTYGVVPLGRLPHVEATTIQDWSWVPEVEAPLDWSIFDLGDADAFLRAAATAGVVVPESFRSFVSRQRLLWAIRSGTGCWWSLWQGRGTLAHAEIARSLGFPPPIELDVPMAFVPVLGRYVVRFLTDQQDCCFWFLVLGDSGGAVLASWTDIVEEPPTTTDEIMKVADTFGEFMYRFWIENEIAFRTDEGVPLTPAQETYLSEARRLAGAPDPPGST